MKTQNLYDQILKYFDIRELVSENAYNQYIAYGEYFLLSRFDKRLLENLLWIRIDLGRPITINDYLFGGDNHQRGLRDNLTPIVQSKKHVYLSGHALAMAIDFDVDGMTAQEVREYLERKADFLPHPIRLEGKYKGHWITWVHMDVCDDPRNPKVYIFHVS